MADQLNIEDVKATLEPRPRPDQIEAFRQIIAQVRDRQAYVMAGPGYVARCATVLADGMEAIFDAWDAYDRAMITAAERSDNG